MIKEVLDESSGAILFKQDEDGQRIEQLEKEISSLKDIISKLEKKINKLSK